MEVADAGLPCPDGDAGEGHESVCLIQNAVLDLAYQVGSLFGVALDGLGFEQLV